jgi:hypothetical protein
MGFETLPVLHKGGATVEAWVDEITWEVGGKEWVARVRFAAMLYEFAFAGWRTEGTFGLARGKVVLRRGGVVGAGETGGRTPGDSG